MPTKKKLVQKQKQKQRQKQTTIVNVNVAKSRARSSSKKSGKSRGGKGSVMMLPPPIYASPIDRLTPAMYSSQGQQIQQQSLDQMLKNFLSNQQNQQVGSFKTLGSAPGSSSVSYNPSRSRDDVSDITDLDTEWERYNRYTDIGDDIRQDLRDERQDLKGSQLREQFNKFKNEVPTPFQNEERSYLSASEPDYESNAPKFSQNEARVSQQNIYESLKEYESALPFYNRVEPSIYETLRSEFKKMDDEKYKN